MASDSGRVMFVGMNCLDISTTCQIYPEEDSDNDCLDMLWVRGGNASNSSTACALLGGNTQYMGNLADTYELPFFKDSFDELCINYEDCPLIKCQCPRTLVLINAQSGSRTLMYHSGGYPELKAADFREKVKLTPGKYRWIHFEGRPSMEEIEAMIQHVLEFNMAVPEVDRIKVSLELEKIRQMESVHLMKKVDLVFISKDYAMGKGFQDMESATVGFEEFIKPGGSVVCAWGEKGAAAKAWKQPVVISKAFPPEKLVNTTAAGDTFNGATILALTKGQSLHEAITGSVVCAWGEKGAAAKAWKQPVVISKAFPPEKLVNTTAAGDTFNGATILALTKGQSLHEAITYGCKVAGAKCGMRGFERLKEFALQ